MEKNYKDPQRMGWGALIVMVSSPLFELIFKTGLPLLIILIIKRDLLFSVAFILGILVFVLLKQGITYLRTKFWIEDKYFIIKTGILGNKEKTIPLTHIHSFRTKSGPFYQLVDMVGIQFDTLSDKQAEVELILSEEEKNELFRQLEQQMRSLGIANEQLQQSIEDTKPNNNSIEKETQKTSDNSFEHRYSISQLLIGAVTQNHFKGLLIIGSVLAYIYNQIDSFIQEYWESVVNVVSDHFPHLDIFFFLSIFLIVYLISLLFWSILVVFRYYGLRLQLSNSKLLCEYGLLSRQSTRFSRDKIIAMNIKENPLEKKLGICTLRVEQAINVQGKKQINEVFLLSWKEPTKLLRWWLNSLPETEEQLLDSAQSGRGIFWRHLLIIRGIPLVLVALFIYFVYLPLWPLLLLLLAFDIWESYLKMKQSHIHLYPSAIVFYQGSLGKKRIFLPYKELEAIHIRQSPLTPIFGRVTLEISTMGLSLAIRSLKQEDAYRLYNTILKRQRKELYREKEGISK